MILQLNITIYNFTHQKCMRNGPNFKIQIKAFSVFFSMQYEVLSI